MSRTLNQDLRRLIDITDYLVDERVGIVQSVFEISRQAGAPDFFHFYATSCETEVFNEQSNFRHNGGASIHRELAAAKAIGESIERYCSAIYRVGELPLTSYDSADHRCIHPDDFALYASIQYNQSAFKLVPFNTSTSIRWTTAMDPLTQISWYVPACMIFVPYFYYDASAGAPVAQSISTGLACHCSYEEAAISGICEVIERDAFTIFWQAMISPPQLRIETLSDSNYDLVRRLECSGGKITMLDITTDLKVPCVLSVLSSDRSSSPALVFAASASLDPEEAARKSLEEVAHTRRYAQLIKTKMAPVISQPPNHANITNQEGHLGFWANHDHAQYAEFVFSSDNRIEFSELIKLATNNTTADLKLLCEMVNNLGHRVLIADLTTSDVKDLGLFVLHALIPGFHPLYMGYPIRSLGGKRLWTVPQKLGYKGINLETGDNPYPHPYP
jgi:ribosomal protein S12 methylthiotransferase accessory factor